MLEQLTAFAKDDSDAGRSGLLRMLTEMVLVNEGASPEQKILLFDIARRVLSHADIETRSFFAEHMAGLPSAPTDLVLMLARDVEAIAVQVLAKSPILGDSELAELAQTLPPGHLVAIAGRARLSTAVTDILVKRGGATVWRALSANLSAKLSAESLSIMVANADKDKELCRSLVLRSDLPPADAEKIVQLIALELRNRLWSPAHRVEREPSETDAAALVVAAKKTDILSMIADIRAGLTPLDPVVIELAEADRHNDLAHLIAIIAGLDDMSVLMVLVRADANGIATVCKAIGIGEPAYASIVKLRRRRLRFSEVQQRFEREDYHKLSEERAKLLVSHVGAKRSSAAN